MRAAGVLLGLVAVTSAAVWPEWLHLGRALGSAFHFGDPPGVLQVGSGAAALIGALLIGLQLRRGRRVPVLGAVLILAATVGALVSLLRAPAEGRSWASADKSILERGSGLQQRIVAIAQVRGEIPADADGFWEGVRKDLAQTPSPARTRSFEPVPYALRRIDDPERVPGPLVPGTLLLWVSPDRAAFQIHPVGFDPGGQPALLADAEGRPVVLEGAAAAAKIR